MKRDKIIYLAILNCLFYCIKTSANQVIQKPNLYSKIQVSQLSQRIHRKAEYFNKKVALTGEFKQFFSEASPGNLPANYIRGLKTNRLSWETRTSITFAGEKFSLMVPVYWDTQEANKKFEDTRLNFNSEGAFPFGTIDFFNGDESNEHDSRTNPSIKGKGVGPVRLKFDFNLRILLPVETNNLNSSQLNFSQNISFINTPNDGVRDSADYIRPESVGGINALNFILKRDSRADANPISSGNSPLYFQYLGAATKDSSGKFVPILKEIPVRENSNIKIYLFGRLYSTCSSMISWSKNKSIISYKNQFSPWDISHTPNSKQDGIYSVTFTPNHDLSLSEAAVLCGYENFNWYQKITFWGAVVKNVKQQIPKLIKLPITDPPRCNLTSGSSDPRWTDNYPYYYNQVETKPLNCIPKGNPPPLWTYKQRSRNLNKIFLFADAPVTNVASLCVGYFSNNLGEDCHGLKEFTTYLVGVNKDYPCYSEGIFKLKWSSTFSNTGKTLWGAVTEHELGPLNPLSKTRDGVADFYSQDFYAKDVSLNQSLPTGCNLTYDGLEIK